MSTQSFNPRSKTGHATSLCNYGLYVQNVKRDLDEAERLYRQVRAHTLQGYLAHKKQRPPRALQ